MKERSITFKIGTFNVRTLQSETKQQQLADDYQQRPVTNPRQPIPDINRRFEIPSITGTGP